MIEVALELAGAGAAVAIAARGALAARRRRPLPHPRDEVELACEAYARGDVDLEGLELRLDYAIGLRERPQPTTRRELERALFYGPGAVWPVANVNHVQILRPAIAATSYTVARSEPLPIFVRRTLSESGLLESGLAGQLSLDDEQLH